MTLNILSRSQTWDEVCRDLSGEVRATTTAIGERNAECRGWEIQSQNNSQRAREAEARAETAERQRDEALAREGELEGHNKAHKAAHLETQAEVDRLSKLVYVPGVWRCAKCKLVLVSTNMYAATGTFSANNEPQQCSNGCGPMWRHTERDAGNELVDKLEAAEARATATEAKAEGMRAVVEGKIVLERDDFEKLLAAMETFFEIAREAKIKVNNMPNIRDFYQRMHALLAAIPTDGKGTER